MPQCVSGSRGPAVLRPASAKFSLCPLPLKGVQAAGRPGVLALDRRLGLSQRTTVVRRGPSVGLLRPVSL